MTTETTEDEKPRFELTRAEYTDGREWEFVADVRATLHNPDGEDVGVLFTYKARPKHDGLTDREDYVQEDVGYWWPDARPADGDGPFYDTFVAWPPNADLDDDDALLEECKETATHDAAATLDMLKAQGGTITARLTGDDA